MRPRYVVAAFVLVQWLATLAFALRVRHHAWLFYHGGDQTWFYTTGSLLTHGKLLPTYVGYGWSMVLLPLTALFGPNLIAALPVIVLLNVLVLMPLAIAAMYGIGNRIGGRVFAAWVLLLWVTLPWIGVLYTDTGFKARYTEQALPDALGLTALADFPQLVALVCGAYFLVRALQRPNRRDGLLAGLLVGVAIGIKPSCSLVLGGILLSVAWRRRWSLFAPLAAGLVPSLLTLAFWKWRGLGHLPIFSSTYEPVRLALGAGPQVVAGLDLHKYIPLDWHQFSHNLGSLQEHFWSARVFEWIVVAGVIALARRSLTYALLVGGWFFAFVLVKGSATAASLETGGLLHQLVPAIPAFVLLVAALPYLLPGLPRRVATPPEPEPWPRRRVAALAGALLAVFVAAPVALAGVSRVTNDYAFADTGPIPIDTGLDLKAVRRGSDVVLTWKVQHPAGGRPFYLVMRGALAICGLPIQISVPRCYHPIDATRGGRFVDHDPPKGFYQEYRVVEVDNWLDDPVVGDMYLVSDQAVMQIP